MSSANEDRNREVAGSTRRIVDHEGNPVEHGRTVANGVRLHYMTTGSVEGVYVAPN